jgi:hypothetical protein
MFGIGMTELVIVGFLLLLFGAVFFGGLVALVVLLVRAGQRPKNCPHCGKPLK